MKTAIAAAALFLPVTALAEPVPHYFNPGHTQILVEWKHGPGEPLIFHFTEWDASILYDADAIENSSVEITLPLSGLWTGNDRFRGHLLSGDFFEAETWPSARFVSTSVERTGGNTALLHGDMTIRDRTAPVTFSVELTGHAMQGESPRTGFVGKTTILRSQWGLGMFPQSAPDPVTITVSTELQPNEPGQR